MAVCELDMASYLEGYFWDLWQWQNNKSTLGASGPSYGGDSAMNLG